MGRRSGAITPSWAGYCEFRPPFALAARFECLWSVDAAVAVSGYGFAPYGPPEYGLPANGGLRAAGAITRQRRIELPAGELHYSVRFRPGMANTFLKTLADALADHEGFMGCGGAAPDGAAGAGARAGRCGGSVRRGIARSGAGEWRAAGHRGDGGRARHSGRG